MCTVLDNLRVPVVHACRVVYIYKRERERERERESESAAMTGNSVAVCGVLVVQLRAAVEAATALLGRHR